MLALAVSEWNPIAHVSLGVDMVLKLEVEVLLEIEVLIWHLETLVVSGDTCL